MYAIITGASRGIGKELAITFASHKYNLVLNCKNNFKQLCNLKSELEKKYNVRVYVKKDQIEYSDIEKIDDIYILINNASIPYRKLLIDIDKKEYNEVIDSNLTQTVFTTKFFIKKNLKRNQGIVINISSIWGSIGASMESIYSLTKAAIENFTKSLSKEYVNFDFICFSLGAVDTDMNNIFSEEDKKVILKNLKNNSFLNKNEITDIIYNTISNHKYKSGDIIYINNGLT